MEDQMDLHKCHGGYTPSLPTAQLSAWPIVGTQETDSFSHSSAHSVTHLAARGTLKNTSQATSALAD